MFDSNKLENCVWKTILKNTLLLIIIFTSSNRVFPANLLLYYDFEGDSGSTVIDKSGNGYNGNLYYSPTFESDGVLGTTCLETHLGTSVTNGSFVRIELPDGFTFNNEVTYAVWAKRKTTVYGTTTGANTASALIGFRLSSYDALFVENNESLPTDILNGLQFYIGGFYPKSNLTLILPDDDQWHFVAIRLSATEGLLFQVDDQVHADPTYTTSIGETTRIYLAQRGQQDAPFSGYYDEFRVYEGALTAAEINQLYFSGLMTCQEDLIGDINGDCVVDINDLQLLVADWLDCTVDEPGCVVPF